MTKLHDVKTESSQFIVVEGPIGVGKTSLAKKLSESLSGTLILEDIDNNPFLDRFYKGGRGALPAQLHCLFQRAKQLEILRQSDLFSSIYVADFHLEKDKLFASVNLDSSEMELYEKVYENMDIENVVPDLVIYLQANPSILLERIARRNVPSEKFIDRNYLENITESFARHYHSYDDGPLLIVNTASIDPLNNEIEYKIKPPKINLGGFLFFN